MRRQRGSDPDRYTKRRVWTKTSIFPRFSIRHLAPTFYVWTQPHAIIRNSLGAGGARGRDSPIYTAVFEFGVRRAYPWTTPSRPWPCTPCRARHDQDPCQDRCLKIQEQGQEGRRIAHRTNVQARFDRSAAFHSTRTIMAHNAQCTARGVQPQMNKPPTSCGGDGRKVVHKGTHTGEVRVHAMSTIISNEQVRIERRAQGLQERMGS